MKSWAFFNVLETVRQIVYSSISSEYLIPTVDDVMIIFESHVLLKLPFANGKGFGSTYPLFRKFTKTFNILLVRLQIISDLNYLQN